MLPRILSSRAAKFLGMASAAVLVLSGFALHDIRSRSLLRTLPLFDHTADVEALGHPSFADVREYERKLPQHILPGFWSKTRPKYMHIAGEAYGSGWNNVFQEQLLNTHLGYVSNRAYVFGDFIPFAHPPFPDTLPDGTRHPLHIPMNAMVSGPTGGGPWSLDSAAGNSTAPRPIAREWWDAVCPETEIVRVEAIDINAELNITEETDAAVRMEKWGAKLRDLEAECLRIEGTSIFGWLLIGGDGVLPLWPTYGSSPTLKAFAWSPLITRALERNFHLLSAAPPPPHLSRISSSFRLTSGVASSLEMQLARDEQAVTQAIDMSVLVGAETFIGVGFSSMTSNVVQLRLSSGKNPNTCRFW
ncbi:hypothetical protein C8J57DRAFT_1130470 [Mycena rebaudengoi]|nr:hypothetical protein C8J57DRAFT_1130470 [Mycena rebaudengoi]